MNYEIKEELLDRAIWVAFAAKLAALDTDHPLLIATLGDHSTSLWHILLQAKYEARRNSPGVHETRTLEDFVAANIRKMEEGTHKMAEERAKSKMQAIKLKIAVAEIFLDQVKATATRRGLADVQKELANLADYLRADTFRKR